MSSGPLGNGSKLGNGLLTTAVIDCYRWLLLCAQLRDSNSRIRITNSIFELFSYLKNKNFMRFCLDERQRFSNFLDKRMTVEYLSNLARKHCSLFNLTIFPINRYVDDNCRCVRKRKPKMMCQQKSQINST